MADKSFLPPSMRPERSYADTLATIEQSGALDEYLSNMLRDAAKGVRPAQAELTDYALHRSGNPKFEVEVMVGAEVFARLAAQHGEGDDQIRLAGVLMKRAEHMLAQGQDERAKQFAVEAFLALEPLFEHGQPEPLLGSAALLNEGVGEGEDERNAVLFDAAIAALKPASAKAITKHIKGLMAGGRK